MMASVSLDRHNVNALTCLAVSCFASPDKLCTVHA